MDERATARLQMIGAALLFSTGGLAIKACQLTGWQVAGFRSGLGALTLLVLIPATRRGWTWRTWLVGGAYAATLCLYVLANKTTTAANTIFLQSTAPLYLLLVSPWLLGERIRLQDVAFMAALAVGLALFFLGMDPPQETAPQPLLGNVLAALAGLAWALTIAGLRWLARTEGEIGGSPAGAAAAAAVAGNLLVFALCLGFALPVGRSTASDWLWIVYLGVFQVGLAYVFMTRGMRKVPALEGSLLLLIEPVLNAILAWVVLGEVPGPWSRVGCGVILLATLLHSVAAAHADRQGSLWGWLGAVWGIVGVSTLLGFAVYRLTPLALQALRADLTFLHWAVLVPWVLFMLYSEAYRGFQKAFSPRVAARCRYLRGHPTVVRVLFAPFFAMAFFGATKKRRIVAYSLTSGIVVLVVLVQHLHQPWRGIVDVGVVIGLIWGLVATWVYWGRALFGATFDVSPEVEEPKPAAE